MFKIRNKRKAEKRRDELEKTYTLPFCPKIKGSCRKDCVSYLKAHLVNTTDGADVLKSTHLVVIKIY